MTTRWIAAAHRRRPACLLAFALASAMALPGCTSVDPSAGLSPSNEIGGGRLASMSAAQEPTPIATPAAASLGPVQFLPVVGAPVPVVEMLSAALAEEAARAGVAIAPSDGPATPLRLKGYLSALGEGRETIVVYVWDVVDPAGNRVSRIQGQERAPGAVASADPWAGVSQPTLAVIARRTIADLARTRTSG